MKKLRWHSLLFVLIGFSFVLSSCTEDPYDDNEPSAIWETHNFTVYPDQWRWNEDKECWYYVASPNPAWLDEYIAVNGVVLALVDEGDVFHPLPYDARYYWNDGPAGYYYTEAISYEFDVNYLCFMISTTDNFAPEHEYKFQIRMVW
jgi:hypothetical protein